VLEYRNTKLAVVEAKAWDEALTEGVGQAKDYAGKLALRFSYATNGHGIYAIDMKTGAEGDIATYPTPDELWNLTFPSTRSGTGDAADKASELAELWRDRFAAVPFEDKGGSHPGRYYQDIAVERVMQAIAEERQRILLTLATGAGKTFIAFQIAWKLFHARWNLGREAIAAARTTRATGAIFLIISHPPCNLASPPRPGGRITWTPTPISASRSIPTRSRTASMTASSPRFG
jgi:type I restriction enzyme R subunit